MEFSDISVRPGRVGSGSCEGAGCPYYRGGSEQILAGVVNAPHDGVFGQADGFELLLVPFIGILYAAFDFHILRLDEDDVDEEEEALPA